MGLLAKISIYIIIAVVANDWTNGDPVPKAQLEPDSSSSFLEKAGAGPESFAAGETDANPARVPREIAATNSPLNTFDPDFPEAHIAKASSVVKRQNPAAENEEPPTEEPNEANRTRDGEAPQSPIMGRGMKMG